MDGAVDDRLSSDRRRRRRRRDAPRQRREAEATSHDPSLYLNRELSWLDFNDRVLQLAEDERVPLLERVKFCAIYTTNLDEFYMVRVAGLRDQIDAGVENPGQDGRTPSRDDRADPRARARAGPAADRLLRRRAAPGAGRPRHPASSACGELDEEHRAELAQHFQKAIFPALTPLAVAPGRPFPYISNLSLSLAVLVRDPVTDQTVFARVKVPTEILPRFVDAARSRAGAGRCWCRSRT